MATVRVCDSTLRDGAHILEKNMTPQNVEQFCAGFEQAGLYGVEVGLGLGLGSKPHDTQYLSEDFLRAARTALYKTKLMSLIITGIGKPGDIVHAKKAGADIVRVAVYSTKPEEAIDYIKAGRDSGITTGVFFMSSHMSSASELAERAWMMQDAGAELLCMGDSSGSMTIADALARIEAIKRAVNIPIGIHAHNSLGLGVAINVAGVQSGCKYVDGTLEGLGETGGNGNLQAIVAILEKLGIPTGVNFDKLNEIAENVLRPIMPGPQELRTQHISAGYHGATPKMLDHLIEA